MRTLILNQSNLVQDGYNNKFVYRFPNSVFFKDDYIAVNSITMYYSWFNITAEYGNNVFQYIWDGVTYTINIPDGLYEVSQLNQLLQFTFIQNGHYLTLSGQNVYFIELVANPTRYAIQINTYLLPVVGQFTLAAGVYTGNVGTQYVGMTTSNALFFPATNQNPQLVLPANFNQLLGYVAGFTTNLNNNNAYVPPVNDPYVSKNNVGTLSYISTLAPNLQPNNSLILSMSNIDNAYAVPSSLLYSITANVGFGEIINERAPNFVFNKLIDGTYNQLRLEILGTNLSQIRIADPAITITLVIKNKNEVI
jgi:hypothetical protein